MRRPRTSTSCAHLRLLCSGVLLWVTLATDASAEDELEVVVSGTQVDRHSNSDASAASTVLRRPDLDAPGATASTVLARVPGMQIQRTGTGSELATASLRGTTSAQTPVYLAGIRLNDDLSGTADLSTVPLWMLDRVEVYRGHAPAQADTLGLGGAVFFEPRYPSGPELRGGATFGSWGGRSVYGSMGQGSPVANSLVAVRRESARNDYGYLDNRGTAFTTADDRWVTRQNADQATTDAWAIGRLALSNSSKVVILSNVFDREQGITGLSVIPSEHARAHIGRELFGVSSSTEVGCSSVRPCQLTSTTSFQRANVTLTDPAFELSLGGPALTSKSNRVSQNIGYLWPLTERFSATAMSAIAYETLDVSRPTDRSLAARRNQGTVGANLQWDPLDAVTLQGIGRVNVQSTQAADQRVSATYPLARLGLSFEFFPHWLLLGNAGYYGRPPTLGELYGTSSIVVGNPALRAEQGFSRDLGTRYMFRARRASAAFETYLFRQDVNNLVGWQRSSFGQIKPYNVGQSRLQGIEIYAGVELVSVIHVESAVTLLDPRDTTPGNTLKNDLLPFRSRLVADAAVGLHTTQAWSQFGLSQAGISLRGTHRSSRYQDPAGLIIVPHTTTFDLEGHVLVTPAALSLRASVFNLFNQPTFDIVGYPLPPRTYALGLEYNWESRR